MDDPKHYTGLTKDEVAASRQQFGSNAIELKEDKVLLHVLKGILLEPMFILLCIACTVYFVVGQFQEGVIMVVAIMIVSGISFYQDYRSRKAIQALRKLSAPRANVLRNRQRLSIATEEIVKHDIVLLQEGEIVPADGLILEANDLSINESLLTGESLPVIKNADNNFNVYKGSLVVSGSAIIQVTETGANTMFGKIGLSLQEITVIKTPLQQQVASFVKYMVWFGSIAFLLVFIMIVGSIENQDISAEATWNQSTNAQFRTKFSIVQVSFTGERNTPIEFALLEGLQNGKNYLWNLTLDKVLSKNNSTE